MHPMRQAVQRVDRLEEALEQHDAGNAHLHDRAAEVREGLHARVLRPVAVLDHRLSYLLLPLVQSASITVVAVDYPVFAIVLPRR